MRRVRARKGEGRSLDEAPTGGETEVFYIDYQFFVEYQIISYGEFGGARQDVGGGEGSRVHPERDDDWAGDGVDGLLGHSGYRGGGEKWAFGEGYRHVDPVGEPGSGVEYSDRAFLRD